MVKWQHLDAATLEEFLAFNKKFYVPNNATLVVAGDIDFATTKKMIEDYFGPIPRGADIRKISLKKIQLHKQCSKRI